MGREGTGTFQTRKRGQAATPTLVFRLRDRNDRNNCFRVGNTTTARQQNVCLSSFGACHVRLTDGYAHPLSKCDRHIIDLTPFKIRVEIESKNDLMEPEKSDWFDGAGKTNRRVSSIGLK